jgi:hypothetical protein
VPRRQCSRGYGAYPVVFWENPRMNEEVLKQDVGFRPGRDTSQTLSG